MTKAIAEGFHSVTPMIMFKNAQKAIEFYKRALGAVERFSMPGPDGKGVMHAEIMIGNSIIMMSEENPQNPCTSAETAGGSPVSFYIYTEAVDEAFRRAVEAGAKIKMSVQDMFWGDRAGTVEDPFGYSWMLATHTKDLTDREIEEGAKAFFVQMGKK
ncbi:MAG TPA: VOC family protein [Dissulfurispiraceae bacterium]|nr:VOC family protein [Dissulfurispiraceae bacterium]